MNRRIADLAPSAAKSPLGGDARSAAGGTVNWRFTTAEARIKSKQLYPSIENG
jgi:hypothetical protein